MLSLYLELKNKSSLIGLAVACALVAPGALAAEAKVQPLFEIRAVAHDNLSMSRDPVEQTDEYGTQVDLAALVVWETPTGSTSVRPRVRFQDYSTDEDVTNFEAFLDLRSQFETERSRFLLVGRFDRRDSTLAEFADAGFDDLDPEDPTSPESGVQTFDQTRQRYELRPSYSYRLSERAAFDISASYQSIDYSDEIPARRVGYDYVLGEVGMSWAMGPQTDLKLFGGASRYERDDGLNDTDSLRAGVALEHRWSAQSGVSARVVFQQDDISSGDLPGSLEDENVSAELTMFRKGEVDEWRLVAGSAFSPSSAGGINKNTQFRVSYQRSLSEKTRFLAAIRYVDYTSVGDINDIDERTYTTADLEFRRFLTPTWYVKAGYTYRLQDRDALSGSAVDNQVFISIGYQGLSR